MSLCVIPMSMYYHLYCTSSDTVGTTATTPRVAVAAGTAGETDGANAAGIEIGSGGETAAGEDERATGATTWKSLSGSFLMV